MYIQPIEWRMHGILNSQSDAGKFETCAPLNEVKRGGLSRKFKVFTLNI